MISDQEKRCAAFFSKVQFLQSANSWSEFPPGEGMEIAFVGRSNAGKSSTINAITQRKQLARVSHTPGRTQCFHFFSIDEKSRLVDLPGFGYAKVSKQQQQHWHQLIDDYLRNRKILFGIIHIVDSRHPLKPFDEAMLNWAQDAGIHLHVLLNKIDKLTRNQAKLCETQLRKKLAGYPSTITVQAFSAVTKHGLQQVQEKIMTWVKAGS